ncbi:MAG: insulinase family protein [Chlorobi bacterium]|nr:insulinase family protein [Chlorobiota bacterium]
MTTINRLIQPGVKLIDSIALYEPEHFKLDNGIPVFQINAGTQDMVKIDFVFEAGSYFQEKLQVSKFTNKLLNEGTKSYSSSEIAEKIDYYGAFLEVGSDKDVATVTLYTLNKYLERMLEVMQEVIRFPVFPEHELETYKQNRKQQHIINSEKVKFVSRLKFSELIFGSEHPYGRQFGLHDFEAINREDLLSFHKSRYSSNDCRIIVAGKIHSELISILNVFFGNEEWNTNQEINQIQQRDLEQGERKLHIVKEEALQTAIRIGRPLFNKTHPDYLKLKVVNMVLGGYFGSRLMTNIREDKGYTYGIGSAVVSLHRSGYFFIASEVAGEVAQKAIDEVYREISILHTDKVPGAELRLVKNYMLGQMVRSMDGPFALSDNLRGLLEYGLDNSFFTDYINIVNNISADEIRELARKYLQIDSLFELRVGAR